MRNARFAVLAMIAVGLVAACPSSSLGQDEAAEAEKAAAEAVAARERAAKASEEARIAEEKALRARRRALEKDLAAKEDALDAARAAGDRAAVAAAEVEVRDIAAKLADMNAGLVAGPVAGEAPRFRRGGAPVGRAEGLPPLQPKPGRSAGEVTGAAFDWLTRHQDPAGFWDCDGFSSQCKDGKCPGAGGPLFDPGVSGLATLAFLGYGETHKTPRHGAVVRNALKYLKGIQDAEGCFGPRTSNHFTYNHAIASVAMTEAYGLTQSPLFKASAQNGINFVLQCQNPYLAWRYGVRPQDNDTAVTGWMVMALKSAKLSGLDVDEEAFRGAIAWLDKVTEPEYGRAGYTARGNGPARPQELMDLYPADRSEALTAEAVLTRIFCGAKADDPMVIKGADLCLRSLPSWDEAAGTIDFHYWYFGTLAMWRMGGDRWSRWEKPMTESLLPYQRGDDGGCARGSYDPVDPWGADGGRVYATAMAALMSEAWSVSRYRPIRERAREVEPEKK